MFAVMQDTDHYTRLLGIKSPWRVSLVELDEAALKVTISVRLDGSSQLQCPQCGLDVPRYDTRRCRWRHLDTMQFQTFVECDVPRIKCPMHKVLQTRVPWIEDDARYTIAFERFVIDWLLVASVSAVGKQLKLSWSAVDGIAERAVARGLLRRKQSSPTHLSIDETSFQRGHEYVTVVTDKSTGAVVHVADDRTIASIDSYFSTLSAEHCQSIESISMDMWPAYITTVCAYVPDADRKICFDKFHVAKFLGDAVDKVRRAEHRELSARGIYCLTGTRYRWLENPNNMSLKAWRSFEELRNSTLRTASAWTFKELAMQLWHYTHRGWAEKQWSKWIDSAIQSSLQPIAKVARTIESHLWGIVNAIVLRKDNAMAESMNNRIQRIKARACGYRNRDRFRTAIMFHCGKLDLYPRYAE